MNLFNFDYQVESILNRDGSESRFGIVYGQGGNVIHTKKDSYTVIPTADLSTVGQVFVDQGREVTPFVHKDGEVIGLTVNLGKRQTKVGDMVYKATITVPNNGGGMGYLSIHQTRLVCTNGMVAKVNGKAGIVKIPHNFGYEQALKIAEQSIAEFVKLVKIVEARDEKLNESELTNAEALEILNKWFYQNECPASYKADNSESDFRRMVSLEFETLPNATKNRYNQFKTAFEAERGYNEELGLKFTQYTVLATVTNYLSRRVEKSGSAAPEQVKFDRTAAKVDNLLALCQ